LREILGAGKKLGNEDIWVEIIKEVDLNGDGEISLEEFKTMMTTLLKDKVAKVEVESNYSVGD